MGAHEKILRNQTLIDHQNSCALVLIIMKTSAIQSSCKPLNSQLRVSAWVCVCICMCVHVCVLCACCGGMYKIMSFRLPAWEDRESVGMLQNLRWVAWHVYNVYCCIWLLSKDLLLTRPPCYTKVSDILIRIGIYIDK